MSRAMKSGSERPVAERRQAKGIETASGSVRTTARTRARRQRERCRSGKVFASKASSRSPHVAIPIVKAEAKMNQKVPSQRPNAANQVPVYRPAAGASNNRRGK